MTNKLLNYKGKANIKYKDRHTHKINLSSFTELENKRLLQVLSILQEELPKAKRRAFIDGMIFGAIIILITISISISI